MVSSASTYARHKLRIEKTEARLRAEFKVKDEKYATFRECDHNFSQKDTYSRFIALEEYPKAVALMGKHIFIRKAKTSGREWPPDPKARAEAMYAYITECRKEMSQEWTSEHNLKKPLVAPLRESLLKPVTRVKADLSILCDLRHKDGMNFEPLLRLGRKDKVVKILLHHQALKHAEFVEVSLDQIEEWKKQPETITDPDAFIQMAYRAVAEFEKPKMAYRQAMREERYDDALVIRRQCCYMRLLGIFNSLKMADSTDIEKWARNAEKGVLNKSVEAAVADRCPRNWSCKMFRTIQTMAYMKVVANLVTTPNRHGVITRLENGTIKPQDIAFMTYEELDPVAAEDLRKFREWQSQSRKVNLDDYSDGMYACPKCKCKKTDFTERQTRSADEPMTVFLFCLGCNQRWRM